MTAWGILASKPQVPGWFVPGRWFSFDWRPPGFFGEVVVNIGDAQLPANRVHPANDPRW